MPAFLRTIPKPVLLGAEALGAGAGAAGLDAVTTHLGNATALPSVQTLLSWFAVGALAWAGANLRSVYAGMLGGQK